MEKVYWNGEPCECQAMLVTIAQNNETPNSWQNIHEGKQRQVLKITQNDYSFFIDNEHGEGYRKITFGMGSPMFSHKSVAGVDEKEAILLEISEMKTVFDREAILEESRNYDDWLRERDIESWQKSKAIKNYFKNTRN